MKRTAFLIHGWGEWPTSSWFPWLQRHLESRGFSVHAPRMPYDRFDYADARQAVRHTQRIVGIPHEQTYFLGHSLGGTTLLRYLETLPEDATIGGAIFVSTPIFDPHLVELRTFFETPFHFASVRSLLRNNARVIHGKHDPYVPMRDAHTLSSALDAPLTTIPSGYHLNDSSGITQLPEALDAFLNIAHIEPEKPMVPEL